MKKKAKALAVLFVLCCSALGAISIGEADLALSATLDGAFSAVASVVADEEIPLQGVSVEYTRQGFPWRISFTRSDLSSFLESLSFNSGSDLRWYQALLANGESSFAPIREKAISYLENSGYEKGDAILDGTITFFTANARNLDSLLSSYSWKDVEIPLRISLIISSRNYPSSLIVEGDIKIIGGDESNITVYSDKLRINGETISFAPFEISY